MKKFSKKIKKSDFSILPLTSMVDMFTILLVFLLSSFSTAEYDIEMAKELDLPETISNKKTRKAPILIASKNEIIFNQNSISQLQSGQLKPKDIDRKDRKFIRPLYQALESFRQDEANKDAERLILQSDSSHSYQLIEQLLYTVSLAGFTDVKIAGIAK